MLKHNPDWKGAGYSGVMSPQLPWAREHFELRSYHVMQQPLTFTRAAWRGRFRACRGVGASLSADAVERFDGEHRELLEKIAPESFEVPHQMTIHVYQKG